MGRFSALSPMSLAFAVPAVVLVAAGAMATWNVTRHSFGAHKPSSPIVEQTYTPPPPSLMVARPPAPSPLETPTVVTKSFPSFTSLHATPSSTTMPTGPIDTISPDTAIVAKVSRSVVEVKGPSANFSGVKVAQGIVTSAGLLDGLDDVAIVLPNGKEVHAHVFRRDPARNLALLETSEPLPSMDVESEGSPSRGDSVLVVGRQIDSKPSVSRGVVLALQFNAVNNVHLILTDAPPVRGLPGAPLLNSKGQLVGLVYREASGGVEGIAVSTIRDFLANKIISPAPVVTPVPTVPALFRGRSTDINLHKSDMPRGFLENKALALGANYSAKVFYIGRLPEEPGAIVISYVTVFPDLKSTAVASPPCRTKAHWTLLPRANAPPIVGQSWTWIDSQGDSSDYNMCVVAMKSNVLVEVEGLYGGGTPPLSPADAIVFQRLLARVMLSRIP